MVTNNPSILLNKNFAVRPERVEGWTAKSWRLTAPDRSCFDTLSTNGLASKAILGSYFDGILNCLAGFNPAYVE